MFQKKKNMKRKQVCINKFAKLNQLESLFKK